MSTVKQKKIQQHYDEIAGMYDLHYDHPRAGVIIPISAAT